MISPTVTNITSLFLPCSLVACFFIFQGWVWNALKLAAAKKHTENTQVKSAISEKLQQNPLVSNKLNANMGSTSPRMQRCGGTDKKDILQQLYNMKKTSGGDYGLGWQSKLKGLF